MKYTALALLTFSLLAPGKNIDRYNLEYPGSIEGYVCPHDDDKNGIIDRFVYRVHGAFGTLMNRMDHNLVQRSKYEYIGAVFGDASDKDAVEFFKTDFGIEAFVNENLEKYSFYVLKRGPDFFHPEKLRLRVIEREEEFEKLCLN